MKVGANRLGNVQNLERRNGLARESFFGLNKICRVMNYARIGLLKNSPIWAVFAEDFFLVRMDGFEPSTAGL